MEEIFNEKVPLIVDSISMTVQELAKDYSIEKYIRIYISKIHASVSIEGKDEVWVNGMAQLLKTFFEQRKSNIAQLSNFIPYLAGGLIGGNIFVIGIALLKDQIFSAVLSGFLLLLGLLLGNPVLVRKFIPSVKLNLNTKEKKDWMLICTVTSTIVGIFGLIVAIIALWK